VGGRTIRPWYTPLLYGVAGGPAIVKCHSKRFESSGAACKVGSGWAESSVASLRMRLMVGDLVLKVGRAIAGGSTIEEKFLLRTGLPAEF